MSKKFIGYQGRTVEKYEVEGCKGYSEEEIVNFCDRNNFGYWIRLSADGNHARVEIYTD